MVFLSISCGSFLFHLSIPAPYLWMETAQLLLYSFNSVYSSNQVCPSEILIPDLSFISCSFILLYFNFSSYLYPSSSISLIFPSLGNNSIQSVDLTFPLFIIITPHLSKPNCMPMSALKTSTVKLTLWFLFHSFHAVLSHP